MKRIRFPVEREAVRDAISENAYEGSPLYEGCSERTQELIDATTDAIISLLTLPLDEDVLVAAIAGASEPEVDPEVWAEARIGARAAIAALGLELLDE